MDDPFHNEIMDIVGNMVTQNQELLKLAHFHPTPDEANAAMGRKPIIKPSEPVLPKQATQAPAPKPEGAAAK